MMFGLKDKIASIIGAAMGAGLLAASIWIVIQMGEIRHLEKKVSSVQTALKDEEASHRGTVANYRLATIQAERDDLAYARKVEAQFSEIQKERNNDILQKRDRAFADAANHARSVSRTTATNPGSSAIPNLPGTPDTTGDPAGAGEATILADTIACAEAVVKAEGWADWWKQIEGVR